MQELESICPYPGLRPFTEEESLYFKGREDQITGLIHLLEEKKFLMVTGASGDGKSSLIYGGLIPQAKAGFFKASYSNWYVAGFRPDRSPMKNLATALASRLKIEKTTIEVELNRGFSSLVELYKSSSLYIDEESREWQVAGEEMRSHMERQAGNLLIVIDQFEEFFTNPENSLHGVPSEDSRLLINIILETSKISLRYDLPIYVVCTMRSDYIGQCAAFSGLPEFIGFSQFFVPRLQRKELQGVIEVPAILSGNSISHRLTDRLIFDLEEGLDQLPILQHALKQIWKAADNGKETMDLIHYAMVGGIDGEKLPKEDQSRFLEWKEKLPEYEKRYLEKPSLAKVLDIHANKLYDEAVTYYHRNGLTPLTDKEAKLIIGLSFCCLTRIDATRAVRNRMTLTEITRIINVPKFSAEVVAGILNIFREPENTLIRPFREETGKLEPETVLDITHEALIRNWQLLTKWSGREFEYYTVFLDLKQQIDRWIDNSKSGDYLLPIGPLMYFEDWYKRCRPNKFWINRYNESESSPEEKLKESEIILGNLQKFLRISARQLFITRTFVKYGAAKIARIAGLILLLGLSISFVHGWYIRRNQVVIHNLIKEGTSLLREKETSSEWKAFFVLFSSRLDSSNISAISHEITDYQTRIDIALKIFERLFFVNKESNPPIKRQALIFADSLIRLSNPLSSLTDVSALNRNLNNFNDLVRDEYYFLETQPDQKINNHLSDNVSTLGRMITGIFAAPDIDRNIDIKALNIGIENTLNFRSLDSERIKELINLISPFENNQSASQKFTQIFPEKARLNVGVAQSVSHNGGYEKLAYLYAALGDVPHVLRCLDSLNIYNDIYDQNWNNSTNIGGYFLMYGHTLAFKNFVRAYSQILGLPPYSYLRSITNLTGIEEIRRTVKFKQHGNYNENLAHFDYNLAKELFAINKSIIEEEFRDKNELNFNLALLYKQEGVFFHKIYGRNTNRISRNTIDSLFSLANNYYARVSKEFLDMSVEIYISPAIGEKEKRVMKRSHHFIYPDHLTEVEPSVKAGLLPYYGDAYFNYMLTHNLFRKYYHTQDDYKLLTMWISGYFEMYGILTGTDYWNRAALNYPPLSQSTLISLDSIIDRSGYSDALDKDWINLKLAIDYYEKGDTVRAYERVNKLKFQEFNKTYPSEDIPFHYLILNVVKQLSIHGRLSEATDIMKHFSNVKNKTLGYSRLAAFTKIKGYDRESEIFNDSALAYFKKVRFFRANYGELGYDYRTGLVELLILQNKNRQALDLANVMDFDAKLNGVLAGVRTLAKLGKYYDAYTSVPETANSEDRLRCILAIMYVEVQKRPGADEKAWAEFDRDLLVWINYTSFLKDLIEI